MSLKIEDQHGPNQPAEGNHGLQKKLKISYTRDFLLSFSELDVCKRLPSGFDKSLLSEFEDTSQDRFRSSGSLSSQGFRHNEYGSSPPSRGDISNYSWVSHGRWDSRFSRKSDWDSDSQSDRDSDSGRYCGNQPRRSWQVSEHDGLLGSGSFPRPTGHAVGSSVPKFRATNDHYHPNKSNEPYHPPRPYKAVPHFRRDTNDSYNDETFGSSECTSEDRAEEERKRRASFELMRKEQHKAFEGQQKLNPEKCKNEFDIRLLAEDSGEDKRLLKNESEVRPPVSNNDSDRSSFLSPAPASRPLVPPGFSGTTTGKNIGIKPPNHSRPSELGNEQNGGISHAKVNSTLNRTSNIQEEKQCPEQMDLMEQQLGSPSFHVSVNEKSEKVSSLLSALDVSSEKMTADRFFNSSKLPVASKALENSKVVEPDARDVVGNELAGESGPTSILEKLFGSALTLNGGRSPTLFEHNDAEADVSASSHVVQSSKFAQWFLQEEKQPVDGLSSRPNDLLSLIVGGEKGGSQHLSANATEKILPNCPSQSFELAERHMSSNIMSTNVETTEQYCSSDKPNVPSVLTCEDLEQSLMSGISESSSSFLPPVQGWSSTVAKAEQQKADIDDLASQHLLSLLSKGSSLNHMALSHNLDVRSPENPHNTEVVSVCTIPNSREVGAENVPHSGKPLTLEALFGTAFMKELQLVGTTASGQKDLVGSARADVSNSHCLSLPVTDDDHISSTVETAFSMPSFGSTDLASHQIHQMRSDTLEKCLLGFDPEEQLDSSQLQSEVGSKLAGSDKSLEVRLPEQDSLIAVSGPLNVLNFMPPRNSTKAELSIQDTPADSTENFSALGSVIRDERPILSAQEGPSFLRGFYSERESDVQHHDLHVQTSSAQLHPQLNHTGPMFHPMDSHLANVNPQMKFVSPGNTIHRDNPHHQYPTNMHRPPFHHHGAGMAGLDLAINNPALQQMQMHGNVPPHHPRHGCPRGVHLPQHVDDQVTDFMQGPSPVQCLSQRHSDVGGLGFPPQGGGTNQPEALQRLIEMELRSNAKQVHPFPPAGHSPGIYGHELDMGFGYI